MVDLIEPILGEDDGIVDIELLTLTLIPWTRILSCPWEF